MLTSTAQFTPKWGAQLHRNIQLVTVSVAVKKLEPGHEEVLYV